jgi:hypothetical protein
MREAELLRDPDMTGFVSSVRYRFPWPAASAVRLTSNRW